MNARQRRRERRIDARIDAGIARGIEAHEVYRADRIQADRAYLVRAVEDLFRSAVSPELHSYMPRVTFQ